jgi:hypothetical protein
MCDVWHTSMGCVSYIKKVIRPDSLEQVPFWEVTSRWDRQEDSRPSYNPKDNLICPQNAFTRPHPESTEHISRIATLIVWYPFRNIHFKLYYQ